MGRVHGTLLISIHASIRRRPGAAGDGRKSADFNPRLHTEATILQIECQLSYRISIHASIRRRQ